MKQPTFNELTKINKINNNKTKIKNTIHNLDYKICFQPYKDNKYAIGLGLLNLVTF